MKTTDTKAKEEIKVYQSLWKNLILVILCLAFALVGCLMIGDDDGVMKVGGWVNIVFFGGGGLFTLTSTLLNRIRHIPLLTIYKDRLEWLEQRKGVCHSVKFADVESFQLTKVQSVKIIIVHYKTTPFTHGAEAGAEANIPVENLTMKGQDIYDMLSGRLKKYNAL